VSRADFIAQTARDLKRRRLAFGLSQAEVADAVKASPASISNWERGLSVPSAYSLELLKGYFRRIAAERQLATVKLTERKGESL
jgi:transcriptional regulator with XRE-family HTH domain